MVYESNKNSNEAVKFYKKFVACAKLMEDKIGIALGNNIIYLNLYTYKYIYDNEFFLGESFK